MWMRDDLPCLEPHVIAAPGLQKVAQAILAASTGDGKLELAALETDACYTCGKVEESTAKAKEFLRCSACKAVTHCLVDCQRRLWKLSHKTCCMPLKKKVSNRPGLTSYPAAWSACCDIQV